MSLATEYHVVEITGRDESPRVLLKTRSKGRARRAAGRYLHDGSIDCGAHIARFAVRKWWRPW